MLTLDTILVPDFGQTAFDNVELNLGPFEQQFSENRLFYRRNRPFNKGNLLFRRIGGTPSHSTHCQPMKNLLKIRVGKSFKCIKSFGTN
jgi:hypothetical protein